MEIKDTHEFSSDRPIANEGEDLLGRAGFAHSLADAIENWHGQDSLVVALHGEWGSGKSSIKNMALSRLRKIKDNKPDIIEFSPWEWAAQEKITTSFFQEISKSIGRVDADKSGKKLAKILRKYGQYLDAGEMVVSGLSKALPTLFVITALAGVGGSVLDNAWVENISTTILVVTSLYAAALKWGKELLYKLSGNAEAASKAKEQSLNDIRQEITQLLKERKSTMIIVMDDLDRLTSSQLGMIFQLIKANLEFPNMVFLLLYQRDVVEAKMSDKTQNGRHYLEKIVQVSFDVPKIEPMKIHNLLHNRLNGIIETDKSASSMFDNERFFNIFHGSLHEYFNTLRAVYRFTSTFSFNFSLFKGKGFFEVNPVDLITIECLRVFEPDVYKEISRSKVLLTESVKNSRERNQSFILDEVNFILDKASNDKRKYVSKILGQLFPTLGPILNDADFSGVYPDIWLRELRICHPSHFDKYFQFSIPDGELSHSDLQRMLSSTNNSSKFSELILSFQERGILNNALSLFKSYTGEIPSENGREYIKGILDVGDRIDHDLSEITIVSSNRLAQWLVRDFLNRTDSIEWRGQLLLECFQKSDGISIVEGILQSEENRRNNSNSAQMLRDKEFALLKSEFVRKLDEMSINNPNDLLSHEHLYSFLFRWTRWGKEDAVKDWLKSHTQTTEECLTLLKRFTRKSSSQVSGEYSARVNTYIRLEDMENFIETAAILEKVKNLDIDKLDDEAQQALKAFRDAIDRRERGVEDDW